MRNALKTLAVAVLAVAGCDASSPGGATVDGPALAVNVAALNLEGVGDVVWDVELRNGASTPQVVWQRRLTSSSYGDGAGSVSYVGPCDADPAAAQNTVRVWVVGVYAAPVSAAGTFAAGAAGGAVGSAMAFQNPTTSGPLERTVICQQNVDAAVQFDVALMRPAQQGFFDIAVNFNNIFCSAKFDCCNAVAGACDSDIQLLFEAGGGRGPTMVLGFACTAGARTGVETELYLDALALDCTSPTTGSFAADVTLNPSGPLGNQCIAGTNGMSTCAGVVTETNGVDADTYLFQMGVYRGLEALTSGGVSAQKVYWNVALGVVRPAIASCWLKTRGTADDALGTAVVDNGTITAGTVYPFVQWEVDLGSCAAEPLRFGVPAAMVRPEYTTTGGAGVGFSYGFGPSLPAGSFCAADCQHGGACVSGACACAAGFTGSACEIDINDCAPTPCLNGGSCTDAVNGFTCACLSRYEGATCEVDLTTVDLITNGTFDADVSAWSGALAQWVAGGRVAIATSPGTGGTDYVRQAVATVPGVSYRLTFDVVALGGPAGTASYVFATNSTENPRNGAKLAGPTATATAPSLGRQYTFTAQTTLTHVVLATEVQVGTSTLDNITLFRLP